MLIRTDSRFADGRGLQRLEGARGQRRDVAFPKTWLLSEGWRIHGLIRLHEVPSRPRAVAAMRFRA
jgi:hypothetical protein